MLAVTSTVAAIAATLLLQPWVAVALGLFALTCEICVLHLKRSNRPHPISDEQSQQQLAHASELVRQAQIAWNRVDFSRSVVERMIDIRNEAGRIHSHMGQGNDFNAIQSLIAQINALQNDVEGHRQDMLSARGILPEHIDGFIFAITSMRQSLEQVQVQAPRRIVVNAG
jgi:hypothetical protein